MQSTIEPNYRITDIEKLLFNFHGYFTGFSCVGDGGLLHKLNSNIENSLPT